MARIRSVKPEFFRNLKLYRAEVESGLPLRVAFAGLWVASYREGRFKWTPEELKLDAMPYDQVDFSRVLDAFLTRGYIVKYIVKGEVFGCIPSWDKHQVINNREKASDLPDLSMAEEVIDASMTRDSRDTENSEGKGKEGKGRGKEFTPQTPQPENASVPALVPSNLFTAIRMAFQSRNPIWGGKPEAHVEALHWLVTAFETLEPGAPEEATKQVLEFYYLLIETSPEKFWRKQPFTPCGLRSMWDRVIGELKAQAGTAPLEADDGSWVENPDGGTQ